MPQPNAQSAEQVTRREHVFDENGQTVEVVETLDDGDPPETEAVVEGEAEEIPEAAAPAKYRIGDREFANQDEALAYAQSQVSALSTEAQVSDAYRQGIRDAISQKGAQTEQVTQTPAPAINAEELYTNPQEFLTKYAEQIKRETIGEVRHAQSAQAQSDQIWREFTDRHPAMADFRGEVEAFVEHNQSDVRGIVATKGKPASYDFIATKLKSRFERYANSLKPVRELPNVSGGASPAQKATSVTSKAPEKKALSFSEQIRSIRKRR